jgi:hypothetical protein
MSMGSTRSANNVVFPVYVLAKDSNEVFEYVSQPQLQSDLEPIDIENNEYEAWDANGGLLRLSVSQPKSTWLHVSRTGQHATEADIVAIKARAVRHAEQVSFWRRKR